MKIDPALISTALNAIALLARSIDLYQAGKMTEADFRRRVDDMQARLAAADKAWEEATKG